MDGRAIAEATGAHDTLQRCTRDLGRTLRPGLQSPEAHCGGWTGSGDECFVRFRVTFSVKLKKLTELRRMQDASSF